MKKFRPFKVFRLFTTVRVDVKASPFKNKFHEILNHESIAAFNRFYQIPKYIFFRKVSKFSAPFVLATSYDLK